jgi:hypothetical protein
MVFFPTQLIQTDKNRLVLSLSSISALELSSFSFDFSINP